jgi:cell division protease FtsH
LPRRSRRGRRAVFVDLRSDFVELYWAVGASRVRDLFDQAKKQQPAIVSSMNRRRRPSSRAGMGGGHDEREQTINQLLVEMDGFGANEGVIIIAATNRPDILDPRFCARPLTTARSMWTAGHQGREAILRLHARNKKIDPSVDFPSPWPKPPPASRG